MYISKKAWFFVALACLIVASAAIWQAIENPQVTCGVVPLSDFSSYTGNLLQRVSKPVSNGYDTCVLKNATSWDGGYEIAVVRLTDATASEVESRLSWKRVSQRCAIVDKAAQQAFHTTTQGTELTWNGQPITCRNGSDLDEFVVGSNAVYYVFVDNNDGGVSLYFR